ncbi:MAG TPA: Na+/H+ antiporter NhaA [Actinomycetota bacterium]|nr:Na+/H+ antiporter NhaA [Actinomycetota bacterium]
MANDAAGPPGSTPGVRQPWSRSERRVPRVVLQPLQSFLQTEVAGGVLLLIATAVALVWANAWEGSYERVWSTELTIGLGAWNLTDDLAHWVSDGLMTLFFLVVGLEIKREILTGELRDRRAAAVPVLAALGGMVVPALLFLAIVAGGDGSEGWGVPMATDIAFALGVLTLVARSAPASLKPFLLTLAIVDDIGAIVVIAVFYSDGVSVEPLLVAVAACVAIALLQRIHVRATAVYVLLGVAVWVAAFESGVHPTIAGVVLGLLTPAVPFQRPTAVSGEAHRIADETVDEPSPPDADAPYWLYLAGLSREAVSPLARVESLLHPWVSFVIMPLFALSNAGVGLSAGALSEAATSRAAIGIVVGLVVGKPLGIALATAAAVRTGIGPRPTGAGWRDVVGVGALAGIGFTISLLITDLAFAGTPLEESTKVGILAASILAGAIGAVVLGTGRSSRRSRTMRSSYTAPGPGSGGAP